VFPCLSFPRKPPSSDSIAHNIKGALALPHPDGRLQFGADLNLHFRTLIGTGCNPKVAAVVVIGIEDGWTKKIVDAIAKTGKLVSGFGIEGHGDHDTIKRASKAAREYVQWATEKQREVCKISELWVSIKCGKSIPPGWALDALGQPTTDTAVGMQGLMLPVGAASSPKSAMLAVMIEILFYALIGAQFSDEVSIFFIDEGNQPDIGQTFILVDAEALTGRAGYLSRLDELVAMMQNDPEVRLLSKRRLDLERQSRREGIEVSTATLKTLGMNL
jgi:hypothetical protein